MAMAFGGPRSSCVRPGAHSARHQDSRNDWTPCRMDPTPSRGASHSARRLRSLAFLCSSHVCAWKPAGYPDLARTSRILQGTL